MRWPEALHVKVMPPRPAHNARAGSMALFALLATCLALPIGFAVAPANAAGPSKAVPPSAVRTQRVGHHPPGYSVDLNGPSGGVVSVKPFRRHTYQFPPLPVWPNALGKPSELQRFCGLERYLDGFKDSADCKSDDSLSDRDVDLSDRDDDDEFDRGRACLSGQEDACDAMVLPPFGRTIRRLRFELR